MSTTRRCPECGETAGDDAAFCPRDGAALVGFDGDADRYIGTVILGDIEIRAVAGAGSMGHVYRAWQRSVDRDVAVKILRPEVSANTHVVRRFEREAKIASKVRHPNVVEIYFAGQLADGALYIVMEYLAGRSLADALQAEGGSFAIPRTLNLALQICDAVGAGHAAGVVHRDIKPENIMLVRRGGPHEVVKVLDFGIAKAAIEASVSDTAAGLVFGTPRYISPEGAHGASVGPPGDVYAIATLVYQMLAGSTPFEAESPVGFLVMHLHGDPPPLAERANGRVPASIARVVMENLAKDPARRASDAHAFGDLLRRAAREASIAVVAEPSASREGTVPLPVRPLDPTVNDVLASSRPSDHARALVQAAPPAVERRERPSSRRRWPVVAAIIAAVVVIGAALVREASVHRRDAARNAHVAKVRRAIAEERFVAPPGENVRDLLADGAARWPEDDTIEHLRLDTTHELETRAMIARSAGKLGKARELAQLAMDIDPSDANAKALVQQYDDDARHDGGGTSTLIVLIDIAREPVRAGQRVELGAHVVGLTTEAVTGARFEIRDTRPPGARFLAASTAGDAGFLRAAAIFPREGDYEITFDGRVGTATLRAQRNVHVVR